MNKDTITCKRCKSEAEVVGTHKNFLKMAFYSFIFAVILLIIPFIGKTLAPVFFIITIFFAAGSVFMKYKGGAVVECKRCHFKYKMTKEEYDEYKNNQEVK